MHMKYKKQSGLTLLESLIALVVTAIGILGVLGVQMRTMVDTKTSANRALAIHFIDDLGERMRVNPNAMANIDRYVGTWATQATALPSKNCSTTTCSNAELATYDVAMWRRSIEATFPQLGNVRVFKADGETVDANRRQLGVMISWRENERGDAAGDYGSYIDATKSATAGVGGGSTTFNSLGGTVSCPSGFTCHLQYIAVSARCAPYLTNGVARYFCPGA